MKRYGRKQTVAIGIRLPILLALLAAMAAPSGRASEPSRLEQGVAALQQAVDAWQGPALQQAAQMLRQAAAADPDNALACYWSGVAHYQLAAFYLYARARDRNPDKGVQQLEAGIADLKQALAVKEQEPESHALLAVLLGMKIRQHILTAFSLGPQVETHRNRALALDPKNPRVHFLTGVSLWFAPEIFGGGAEGALNHLFQAEKLFALEAQKPAAPLEPRWGYSTCLAQIGDIFAHRGKPAQAREYYQRALQIHPQDLKAQEGLAGLANP